MSDSGSRFANGVGGVAEFPDAYFLQLAGALAALLFVALSPSAARAQTDVDLELVLAVDISFSMDYEEQRLQRDGYVSAFRDPQILKAIQSGANGRIAVTYVEWAGPETQNVVVP